MPFLGQQPVEGYKTTAKQTITGDGSTSYTLDNAVTSGTDLEVFVNSVRQEPGTDYTASGNTITFTTAVESSDSCWLVYQGRASTTTSIESDNLADGSVTDAKISGVAASKLTGSLPALDGSALTGIESLPDAIDVNASAPADSLNIASNGSLTVKPNIAKTTDTATLVAQIGTNDASDPLALKFTVRTGQGSNNYIAMDCAEGTTNRDFVVGYHSTEHFRIKADGRGLSQFTAKAWVRLHQGNNSIYDSHNVSSISHPEAGQTLVNFSSGMGYTNYCAVASSGQFYSGNCGVMDFYSSSLRVVNSNSSQYTDNYSVNVVVFGD